MRTEFVQGLLIIGIIPIIINISSCTYNVPVNVAPAETVYSIYEKIKGKAILILDDNIKNCQKTVKSSSYFCVAHCFPVNLGLSLGTSIKQSTELIFSEVVEMEGPLTNSQFQQVRESIIIYVKLKDINPSVYFTGYTFAKCITNIDVTVLNTNMEKMLIENIVGFGEDEGPSDAFCRGGEIVISKAISKSIQNTMEKYVAILANSVLIREYFESIKINKERSIMNTI